MKDSKYKMMKQPVDLVENNNDDGNESVDSLEVCLQARNNTFDDRDTPDEKMQKALRGIEEALNTNKIINRRSSSSSDESMRSDVGKFMDIMPSSSNKPNPVTRYSPGGNKQEGGDADHLAMAKIHALSTGIEAEDTSLAGSSSQDSPSSFDDYYVAKMVADIQRRRSKKEMQKTYGQTYDLEDRGEVDGEIITLRIDDEMDNSTSSGTCYSDDEGEDCILGELRGLFFETQRKISLLGNERDEIRKDDTRKRRAQNKKSASEEVTLEDTVLSGFTCEDATLFEGTAISGYTCEDTTFAGTLLSGSTRGETIMSGTTEYEMSALERPALLAEPNYLAEDDNGREDESASNKAFFLIHNICFGPWFRSNDNQSSQSEGAKVIEGETNAKESDVVAFSVNEDLERTRSKQSEVAAANELKERESSNKSMSDTALVRTPTQSELKTIYESGLTDGKKSPLLIKDKPFSKTVSTFRAQTNANLFSPITEDDAGTVETSNQRQRNELNTGRCDESAKPSVAADEKKKSLCHKIFSFRSKKKWRLKDTAPLIDSSTMPVSPARTVATGTSDTSIESKSRDEDDDVCASYAALAITRTKSKVLISI